jgi:ethanolamine-phosphate cytidylyltransferase
MRQAKQLCETLVVGVVSTAEIEKRKGLPVMNIEERMILA